MRPVPHILLQHIPPTIGPSNLEPFRAKHAPFAQTPQDGAKSTFRNEFRTTKVKRPLSASWDEFRDVHLIMANIEENSAVVAGGPDSQELACSACGSMIGLNTDALDWACLALLHEHLTKFAFHC